MCGTLRQLSATEFIARLFATVTPLPNLAPTWNMAPARDARVVRLIDGERYLDALKWGLMPYLTKDLKNGATIPTEPSSAMQDGPSLRG